MCTVYLGSLFVERYLHRAMCCRLSYPGPLILPSSYKLNHPKVGRITVDDPPRDTEKTSKISLNWTLGDEDVEIVDGTKGVAITRV